MEKTEKRTAEDFLKKNASFEFEEWKRDCPGGYKLLMRAMGEYTTQELAEYKAAIQELIPIAEERLKRIVNYDMPDYYKKRDEIQSKIDNAKKLINKL